MKTVLLAAVLAAAACQEHRVVDLSFGGGMRTPVGFRCRDDEGHFLVARAFDEDHRTLHFSLVIDFIRLGGLPSCRPIEIAAFCEATASCSAVTDPPRVCIPFERTLETAAAGIEAIGVFLRSLDGTRITNDAPHDPVIIRAVATAQSCDELRGAAPYEPTQLIGCAVSCPLALDTIEGPVILDLPTLSDRCADSVTACALGQLNP